MGFISDALGLNNPVDQSAPGANIGPWQAQQQQLAQLLQGQAAGTSGPNPAQIQYQMNAEKIAQSQAALNANNRAINPALAARMSSNAAVQAGQGAAAGAAAQQGQQQLASQQLLGTTLAQAVQGQNTASGIQAGIGAGNQAQAGNVFGGILNAGSSAAGAGAMAKGGEVVPVMAADGFPSIPSADSLQMPQIGSELNSPAPTPSFGDLSQGKSPAPAKPGGSQPFAVNGNPLSSLEGMMALGRYAPGGKVNFRNPFVELHEKIATHKSFATGGKIPALVSPGELFVRPAQAAAVADGKANPMKVGEKIPGKAKVKGDSYANDTVPKKLDVGGVVVPRHIMESENPEKAAVKFIRDHLNKNGKDQTPEKSEFLSALNRSIKGRKAA